MSEAVVALCLVKFWERSERRMVFGHLTRTCAYDSVIYEYILVSMERMTQFSDFWHKYKLSRRGKNVAATNIAWVWVIALSDQVSSIFASRVYILSSEDWATKQKYIVCVKCVFSGVKFSFVVQEYGLLLLITLQFILKRLIFSDRPHFHETPYIFGRREYYFSLKGSELV